MEGGGGGGGGEGQGVEEGLSSLYVHTPMHTRVVKNHICTCVYVRTYVSVSIGSCNYKVNV